MIDFTFICRESKNAAIGMGGILVFWGELYWLVNGRIASSPAM